MILILHWIKSISALLRHVCGTVIYETIFCNVDKYYVGYIIDELQGVEDPGECQFMCQKLDGCQFWTWIVNDPGARSCSFKHNITSIYQKGNEGQIVLSGPKFCGNSYVLNSQEIIHFSFENQF